MASLEKSIKPPKKNQYHFFINFFKKKKKKKKTLSNSFYEDSIILIPKPKSSQEGDVWEVKRKEGEKEDRRLIYIPYEYRCKNSLKILSRNTKIIYHDQM